MCRVGLVGLVITDDSDALPFGAPRVLFQFGRDKAYMIDLDAVLAAMGMDLALFQQFCVMCGCDFCDRVPGVGPAKALPMLKDAEHGGGIPAVLAHRAAVMDPRFHEGMLEQRIVRLDDDAMALATQVHEMQAGIDACVDAASTASTDALTAQLGDAAARLESARSAAEAAHKQLAGLRAFKARWELAYHVFSRPDVVLPASM